MASNGKTMRHSLSCDCLVSPCGVLTRIIAFSVDNDDQMHRYAREADSPANMDAFLAWLRNHQAGRGFLQAHTREWQGIVAQGYLEGQPIREPALASLKLLFLIACYAHEVRRLFDPAGGAAVTTTYYSTEPIEDGNMNLFLEWLRSFPGHVFAYNHPNEWKGVAQGFVEQQRGKADSMHADARFKFNMLYQVARHANVFNPRSVSSTRSDSSTSSSDNSNLGQLSSKESRYTHEANNDANLIRFVRFLMCTDEGAELIKRQQATMNIVESDPAFKSDGHPQQLGAAARTCLVNLYVIARFASIFDGP